MLGLDSFERSARSRRVDLATATPTTEPQPAGAPDLRELVRGSWAGISNGPWHRYVDAKHLGPYTPSNIQHWVRKLMRRDPQIALGLVALKSPFFGIEYRLTGGDPKARAFVREVLLERRTLFERLLWSVLNALDFGYSSHELLWDVRDVELDPNDDELAQVEGDGDEVRGTMPGAYVLREVSDLDPERVEILVDTRGRLAGLRVDGTSVLPAEKILHAVHQLEFRNWWGESILDHVYNPWYWSNFLNLFLMRYLESKGNPPLVAYAPWESRAVAETPGQYLNTLDVMNTQIISLRGGGVATLPSEFTADGKPLWSVAALDVGERVDQFLPALQHYEALKLRGLYVPERIATQDSSVGSNAMSGVHLDTFFSNLEVIKRFLVLATINEGVIAPLVRFNFGKSVSVPRLEASELSRTSRELLADLVTKCIAIPRTTKDGRQFNAGQLIDINRSLQALNIPALRADDVAQDPPDPAEAPAPGSPPKGAAELARAGKPGAIVIDLPTPPAPVVHVPAPVVNVSPTPVHVPAPIVRVDAAPRADLSRSSSGEDALAAAAGKLEAAALALSALGRAKDIKVKRNRDGLIDEMSVEPRKD